jgi:putative transposase
MLTEWKKQEDLQFLNEVSSVPLQQGLRNLQKAFANFWAGRTKYPNFKKKRSGGSAEFTRAALSGKTGSCGWQSVLNLCQFDGVRTLPKDCEPSTVTGEIGGIGALVCIASC